MMKSFLIIFSVLLISSQVAADSMIVRVVVKKEITQNLIKPYTTGKITATYDPDLAELTSLTYSVDGKLFVAPESFLKGIKNPDLDSISFTQNYSKKEKIYINISSNCDDRAEITSMVKCQNFSLDITDSVQSLIQEAP